MAEIDDLIKQVNDPALQQRLNAAVQRLVKRKKFGIEFERHLPERTLLYEVPVKRGSTVVQRDKADVLYDVVAVADGNATCISRTTKEQSDIPVANLVCIAEFGEPIFPYLEPLDSVENAPDSSLWHTLIEADNYHALQLLEYMYHGKVDCIYIDPPYNSGAKDWKYNNNYVDGNDSYRHSKWLSMMEKRLLLAKKLLNPNDSVLIVTIDEKEYLHLGCLLEDLFPEARIQMISSVISPRGAMRKDMFTRVEEYIFYVFFGAAQITPFGPDMLQFTDYEKVDIKVWAQMIRTSGNGPRSKRPNLFYPVFFSEEDGSYVDVGYPLPKDMPRDKVEVPEGCFAVYPIRRDGLEVSWALSRDTFLEKIEKGYIKFGKWSKGDKNRAMAHLQTGTMGRIASGEIKVLGRDNEGTVILGNTAKAKRPSSVWNMPSHDAGSKGKNILTNILPYTDFAYPKSLYAVKDTLRFFVDNKPNALIVDFFAGSGTTLHAVNLLNQSDGGHRRCIMVTNNEVSDDEGKALIKQGYRPGDNEWNKLGIARYVTWPRTVCSIEGHDINGQPLKGNYLDGDLPMADGFPANANFFKLGFLDKDSVAFGAQLEKLIPVLWMKAGAIGKCPNGQINDKFMVYRDNRFAILIDTKYAFEFRQEVENGIEVAYIITDYEPEYREISNSIKVKTTYHLYRDYLDNFKINIGRI